MPLRQRQIYWLDKCEPLDGGKPKKRPVIILSTPELIRGKTPLLLVVACSTTPRPHEKQHPIPIVNQVRDTGLKEPCWAIVRWYLWINRFRLDEVSGNCPEMLFRQILVSVGTQMAIDEAAAAADAGDC